jgi:hypothetical protein
MTAKESSPIEVRAVIECVKYHADMLFGLLFNPENGGDVSSKCRLTFNVVH